MSVLAKNFLMPEDTTPARSSSWSAVGSTLLADFLRERGHLHQGVRLRVHGESMLPSLWPGDVVEIASCSLEDVRPGEIVLAQRDGRLFLHRLVATQPKGFVLRGDCVPGSDPQYPRDALLGRLVRSDDRRARQGRVIATLSRALGLVFCHCGLALRLVLRFHSRRKASAGEFRSPEDAGKLAFAELGSTEAGAR